MRPVRIIGHHTGDSYNGNQFDKVEAYHRSLAFPVSALGFAVGYHYFIERDGTIRQARLDDEIGAHDAGENEGSIGVALAGNFDIEYPTQKQHDALGRLLASLKIRWDIGLDAIVPHRLGDSTSCPGKNLPDKWFAYAALNFQAGIANKILAWISLFLTKQKQFSFGRRSDSSSLV